MAIPFTEQKTKWRGILDVITGCYPRFLFGGDVGDILPVFHFHDVTTEHLEPYLKYLADNGYTTVTSEEIGHFVVDGVSPGPKAVGLCFDDAWESVVSVVEPLLKKYHARAVTYVIPGRVGKLEGLADWTQLKELAGGGVIDVQAHTYSHAMMFFSDEISGFLEPSSSMTALGRPLVSGGDEPEFMGDNMLGCPLYPVRSRMSDARRYIDDVDIRNECISHVRENGGAEFFRRDDWRDELQEIVDCSEGRFETLEEMQENIMFEFKRAKDVLEAELGTVIRQVCMPWGVCGKVAEQSAKDAGYETAFADTFPGKRYVRAGTNPYRLMRLKHRYIYCLPGKGRKSFFRQD